MNEDIRDEIARMDDYETILMLFSYKIIKNEQICLYCNLNMRLKSNNLHIDKYKWRCMKLQMFKISNNSLN
jgi:hypothetical protein